MVRRVSGRKLGAWDQRTMRAVFAPVLGESAGCTSGRMADAPGSFRPMSSTPAPLLYESHSHTTLCKHAHGTPSDYARIAEQRGLRGIIITCHCPLPDGISHAVRMRPEEYETYVELVAAAREEFAG